MSVKVKSNGQLSENVSRILCGELKGVGILILKLYVSAPSLRALLLRAFYIIYLVSLFQLKNELNLRIFKHAKMYLIVMYI